MSTTAGEAEKQGDIAGIRARRRARIAWAFLSPALIVTAFVALYPLCDTLYLSLTNTRLGSEEPPRFVGLSNYAELVHDGFFLDALLLTVLFAVMTVLLELALGLCIALLLDARFKGRSAVRAAMLVPWAIPTAVSTQMWKWMYNDVYGVFNDVLVNRLGLVSEPIAFTADPRTSLAAAVLVDVWKTTPFVALLLLAGLQLIPRELYEAARVDGATRLQAFTQITLPLLRPALLVALVFRTLDALRVFDVFYVMFGSRPDMQTLATYAHEILVSISDVGYGSAVSTAIFLVIAVFIVIYVALFRRREA
ncbi:sugar ABC transporter permease [Polyangium jinanense]|uniref:Sugar ABC transporter permease n=1 Tax=Polyangium jinanense TaxID=2829994 RepID=A0A9X4AT20_9BACT|nr:sugar ABC transporter permease [Polyangium jinanense]MDC3955424.1 sugar ABC transporter permease [Polyangium jinanense]MDC3981725.1 sugar ABC transporter permease [Polyangium jinanense]